MMYNDTGKYIEASASASAGYSSRDAAVLCNNAGMDGSQGLYQQHSDETDTMWISQKNPLPVSYLQFDLGCQIPLSRMLVWNFNQQDCEMAGLRDVRIFTSIDSATWSELRTEQYPFRFAKSPGGEYIAATNLDDGKNTPILFHGLTVRYVRIQPLEGKGIGNWGDYVEGQFRHGLSAVRFYAYRPQAAYGSLITAACITADCESGKDYEAMNITSGYGLSDIDSVNALLSSDRNAMWLSRLNPVNREIIFDLNGTYPLKEMYVWNYNEAGQENAGLKKVRIFYGVSLSAWTELKGEGYPYTFAKASGKDGQSATNLDTPDNLPIYFNDLPTRYVKIVVDGPAGEGTWGNYYGFESRYGLGKVRFFCGEGRCVEPDYEFTSLLSSYDGWSGADGIFMAPLGGNESQLSDSDALNRKSIVIFSDTFYGKVNPVNRMRSRFTVLNNTSGEFYGNNPKKINFRVRKNSDGIAMGIVENPKNKEYFYWLQDCVILGDRMYSFTDNIVFKESGMEGFQFDLIGNDLVSIPIINDSLDFDNVRTRKTPMYTASPKTYFGCAILPNGYGSGMPNADGYVYIYGLSDRGLLTKSLLLSRVLESEFENFDSYTFYNGKEFVKGIENAVPICDEGGAEMSITPITSGEDKGKYLYIYSNGSVGSSISYRIAQTPWGPFSDRVLLYEISETNDVSRFGGKKIYTYNSKAHYHISSPDSLLISYNMNTQDFESHIMNAEIYRPRFLRLKNVRRIL